MCVKVGKDGQLRASHSDMWPGHGDGGEARSQAAVGGGQSDASIWVDSRSFGVRK